VPTDDTADLTVDQLVERAVQSLRMALELQTSGARAARRATWRG
jgi:hypothetical protein